MKTKISIEGTKILINGKLTYSEYEKCPAEYQGRLMNCRFIQGIFDDSIDPTRFNRFGRTFDPDKQTDDLIDALQSWYNKGLRAFTVGLQGGGTCFTINSLQMYNSGASGTTHAGTALALSVISIIPLSIVYIFCQKYIVQSVAFSGMKQ